MADVERHEFFPTCLYRFKHDFEDNELNSLIKHIEDNKIMGDISIHSCDSDFLYFIILYQLKNENNYLNLNLIKYCNNSYNLYNGKNLIELFLNKYKNDNKIINNLINLNFLYDILFIIQMFTSSYVSVYLFLA